jgi:hypothetical protein
MANSQDYIISIKLQATGQAQATEALKKVKDTVGGFGKTSMAAGKSHSDMMDVVDKAAKRALIVAPIWMALRTVMTTIISAVKGVISANLEFEDSLARIRTVMQGTSGEIDASMKEIKELIRKTADESRVSL